MSTIELEAQKACLAREVLNVNDENTIRNIWLLLKQHNPVVFQKEISKKRDIGFLKGKAKVTFHDDWSMTPEERGLG
jgi:hypothetical protein